MWASHVSNGSMSLTVDPFDRSKQKHDMHQQKVNNNGLVCNTQNSLRSILAGLSGAEKNGTILYPVK